MIDFKYHGRIQKKEKKGGGGEVKNKNNTGIRDIKYLKYIKWHDFI